MTFNKLTPLVLSFLFSISFFSQTVNNETALNTAINNASPGTTIVLANGIWNNIFIEVSDKNGSSSAPITITAETPGSVLMTGNSRVYMKGSYLTVSGLVFQDADNLEANSSEIKPVIELKECNNCKIINNKIDSYNGTTDQELLKFKWLLLDGEHNEVAYNSFLGKHGIGSIINDNRNSADDDYLKIHHNYFANRTPVDGDVNGKNDQDAIRIGNSGTSLSNSSSEVYNNYFYNFFGEVEVISNKSGNNKYYNNTFRKYAGALTLRHGNDCEVFDNFFIAENNFFSGAVRVIGERHKIYNNYVEGTNSLKPSGSNSNATGGINISNGRVDTELNGYYQVTDSYIINNTFVDCDYGLRVGTQVKEDLTLAPENVVIANNIMLNSSTKAIQENTAPIGTSSYAGNITQNGDWDITSNINNNIVVIENLLSAGTDFYELTTQSAAINAGTGSYAFLENDILGGTRGNNFDAGAEEFGAGGTSLPYTTDDVGIAIGFGATVVSEPTLEFMEENVSFSKNGSSKSITIISNLDWTITENLSWLTVNTTTGSNTTEITLTVTENTSNLERTGNITVNETGGSLSASIAITQFTSFNPDDALEITVDNVTAVGTQTDTAGNFINGPENTIDNNTDTRWSAMSTNGSAFLTFDLGCSYTLSDVSIYFHKSTIRTTEISIATSSDGVNFVDVYTRVSSTLLSQEDYEDFDMNIMETQYIRISGFGNSEDSPWNSIEEVKFFGDINSCNSLSVNDNDLVSKEISIYPIPVTNNQLTISATAIAINKIVIYNVTGQRVYNSNTENTHLEKIDTSNFASGIYYIIVNDAGSSKFVID